LLFYSSIGFGDPIPAARDIPRQPYQNHLISMIIDLSAIRCFPALKHQFSLYLSHKYHLVPVIIKKDNILAYRNNI